jgi:anti-anti-sigma regulatory factor
MNSTIAPTALASNDTTIDFALNDDCYTNSEAPTEILPERPYTLVLQPIGFLDQESSREFEAALDKALDEVSESVLIDFLWLKGIDAYGVSVLVGGVEKATRLNKSLYMQSMNRCIQVAMQNEWEQRRTQRLGTWKNSFAADLEQYLDSKAYAV